jgi:hypothetical protein
LTNPHIGDVIGPSLGVIPRSAERRQPIGVMTPFRPRWRYRPTVAPDQH